MNVIYKVPIEAPDYKSHSDFVVDKVSTIIADSIYLPLHIYQQPALTHPEVKDFYPPTQANNHNLYWSTMWLDS